MPPPPHGLKMFNSSANATEQTCPQPLPVSHGAALIAVNSLFSIVGTGGNVLLCLAVISSRSCRSASSYLLMSLAVADMIVTMFSQPTVVAMIIKRVFFDQCAEREEQLYSVSSYISCSSSIFHLSAISADRAGAVMRPIQHTAFMSERGWKIYVGIAWGLAALFSVTGQIFKATKAARYAVALSFFASFTWIIVSYGVVIWRVMKGARQFKRRRSTTRHTGSKCSDVHVEKRVAATIAIVIVVFTVCWTPMIVVFFARGEPLVQVNGPAFMWIRTLALCNSSMNFIIYTWRLRHFRQAYWNVLCCKTCKKGIQRGFYMTAPDHASQKSSSHTNRTDFALDSPSSCVHDMAADSARPQT